MAAGALLAQTMLLGACADAGTVLPTAETVTFRKTSRPSLGKSTIKYASQKDIKKAVSGLRRVYAAITLDEAKK